MHGVTYDHRVAGLLGRLGLTRPTVTPDALELLLDRVRVRRRGNRWVGVGIALAVVLTLQGYGAPGATGQGVAGVVKLDLVLALAVLLRHETIRRGERDLGRRLPRRTTRIEAVPVSAVIGRRALGALGAVVVVHAAMTFVLFERGEAAGAWGFVAVCAVSYLVATGAVWQVAGRPVLAVDPLTLAVDDRLRSGDAGRACLPVLLAGAAFSIVVGASSSTAVVLLGLAPLLAITVFHVAVDPRRFDRQGA